MRTLLFFVSAAVLLGSPQPPSLRLPSDAVPTRYRLELTVDPAKDDFSGVVTIELKVQKPVSVVWVNSTQLVLKSASFEQRGGHQEARILPGGDDFAGFEAGQPLAAGAARLQIQFAGRVNTQAGASLFLAKRNGDRYLFTQFEPIDARKAFPCFDEPSYKVPWQVTLHVPSGQVAVSNTPIEREEQETGSKKVVFRETKPLPSYLIAFGVGPLRFVDGGTAGRKKVPVRIVVPRGDEARAKYAAEVTAEILTRLEEYFDIPYPFEKADQVSIPLSFGGAMENPGLVTYDASIILAPPAGEDTRQRQREYASVAAHELAHQWFGDLVTMAWWNDTWLNESFATFMSSKLLSSWKPEWQTKVDDQDARTGVMRLDQLASSRQINQPIKEKQDIANAFDGITYEKGGAVLGMFDHSLTPERFRAAVRFYLNSHAGGNGTSEDFVAAIAEIGGPDTAASFRSFLNQPGVPQITAKLECQGSPRILLSQDRFLPPGSTADENATWQIPVCIAYPNGAKRAVQCSTLKQKTASVALRTSACPAWFLGNAEEAGYYYTNYEGDGLNKLIANRVQLSLPEQVGVLNELNNMQQAGKLMPSKSLKLALDLKDDEKRQIAISAVKLAGIPIDYLPEALRSKYANYVEDNFGARARKLGWIPKSGEKEDDELIRPELVPFVARYGDDAELNSKAGELSDAWLSTRANLPADLISNIFVASARHGDAALREKLIAAAAKENDEFFSGALLNGIGAFQQKELVEKNFELFLAGKFDPRLSFFPLMFAPTGTPNLKRLPFEFVKAHYDELTKKLPSAAGTDYASLLPYVASFGCSAAEAQEAETFFGPRMAKLNGGPRTLAQVVERIRLCEAGKKVRQPDLIRYFEAK